MCLFGVLGAVEPIWASSPLGSEISYRHLSDLKYEFQVKIYRDCRGVPMSTPGATIRCSSGAAVAVSLSRKSIRDVSDICSKANKPCSPPNTMSGWGFEEHIFTAVVDFSESKYDSIRKCCEVFFELGMCCRNGSITTGVSGNYYNFAMLNLCAATPNTSAILTEKPIVSVCCNTPVYYAFGGMDTVNRDSLSYRFGHALLGFNKKASYKTGLSHDWPLSVYDPTGQRKSYPKLDPPIGMYLDPVKGELIFTPKDCDEIGVVVVELLEWGRDRSGKPIVVGITRRDMVVSMLQCSDNNPPVIQTRYVHQVCEGDSLIFDVQTEDKTLIPAPPASAPAPDTVILSWNGTIAGADLTILNPKARLKTGRFSWLPDSGSARKEPYRFLLRLSDDHCPLPIVVYKTVEVYVYPRPTAEFSTRKINCSDVELLARVDSVSKPKAILHRRLTDLNGNELPLPDYADFSSSSGSKSLNAVDTLRMHRNGRFIIEQEFVMPAGCAVIHRDTLEFAGIPQIGLASGLDTFICSGTELVLKARVREAVAPFLFEWNSVSGADSITLVMPNSVSDSLIQVDVRSANACKGSAQVRVFQRNNPYVDLGLDRVICSGDQIELDPVDSLASWDDPRDAIYNPVRQGNALKYRWLRVGGDGIPTYLGDSTHVVSGIAGSYIVEVTDSLNCRAVDSMELKVNEFTATVGPDLLLCPGTLVELTVDGLSEHDSDRIEVSWYELPSNRLLHDGITYRYLFQEDVELLAEVELTQYGVACAQRDSLLIRSFEKPDLSLSDDLAICCNAGPLDLGEHTGIPGGNWTCRQDSALVGSNYFETSEACGQEPAVFDLIYRFHENSNGCIWEDSLELTVNPQPFVEIDESVLRLESSSAPYRIARTAGVLNLRANPVNGIWRSDFERVLNLNAFDPSKAPVDTVFNLYYAYTDANACSSEDTVSVLVYQTGGIAGPAWKEVLPFPNPVSLDGRIYLPESFGIEVYSTTGVLLREMKSEKKEGSVVAASELFPASGLYILHFHSGNGILRIKQLVY